MGGDAGTWSGAVSLSLGSEKDAAVIRVGDDGTGVPAADRERVFERFVRLDDARSRGQGGTGLGLAIVREVVRAHGGEVSFIEAACVQVRLPLAQQDLSRARR